MTCRVTGDNNPVVGLMLGELKWPRRTPELSSIGLTVVDEYVDAFGQ